MRPNIIIFVTDDQGYGDLSCMGETDCKTPHLDALARNGVLLKSFYANSPVCSPSRASLLTGRYPARAGVRNILGGARTTTGLSPEVPTLARALRDQGYKTGMVGKWHLGLSDECRPHNHGFDYWFGFMAGCIDYYSHSFYWGPGACPIHDLWEDNEEVTEDGEYFTHLITDRSLKFIRNAGREKPFFLYVAYNAPHYPMHAPKMYLDRFSDLPWDRRIMAAMISAVDDSIGFITDELRRRNILQNTFIFFQSDNGPSREARNWRDGCQEPYLGGSSGELRGHKFNLFEGGIRVPAIICWPDAVPSGQIIDAPVVSMDIFPTALKAAGGDPGSYDLDGLDILPLVCNEKTALHDTVFWEYGKQTAVRKSHWKLLIDEGLLEGNSPQNPGMQLYNLSADIKEDRNLADDYPDITQELFDLANDWRNGCGIGVIKRS